MKNKIIDKALIVLFVVFSMVLIFLFSSCDKEPIYTDIDVYYEYSNNQNGFYYSYDVDGDKLDNEYCEYVGNGKVWRGMESGQIVIMSFETDHNQERTLKLYLGDRLWKEYKKTSNISINVEIP